MNRAAREHISPCKVLANTKQWSKVRVEPQADYAIAKALAIKLVLGAIKPVHTATYFHATWLAKKPYWVANLTLVGTWGQHSYYKEKVHGKTS